VYHYFSINTIARCLFFCSVLSFLNADSQSLTKIDSLKSLISQTDGQRKIDVFYEIIYEYIDVDNAQALLYAGEAFELSSKIGDSLRMVRIGRLKASALRRLDRINEAIKASTQILAIARRNKFNDEIKLLLNPLAVAYTYNAEYDKALELHFESLIIRENEGDPLQISAVLNNIGLVYFKLRNFEKAVEFYNNAIRVKKQANDYTNIERILINIGLCYNQLQKFQLAERYINQGLSACGECPDVVIIEGEFGLGVSKFGSEKFDEAMNNFKKSLEISMKANSKRFEAENEVYIAKIHLRNGDPEKASKSLENAERIAKVSGYDEVLIDVYRQFSLLYNQTENFQRAAFYQREYITLKDSVYSERLIDNLAKVQTKYAERENIATIAAKEEVIRRQRSLNVAIVIIAILGALLIFVLFRSNQVKKKVNAALSEAKSIIEDQNRQLLNSNIHLDKELKEKNIDLEKANESLRRVNDELDNFIYKTSHDIRGPLASLKGMCNVALLDVKDPIALNYLHKLDITAEKLNTILTRLLIVNQINNSTLEAEKIDFHQIVSEVLLLEKKKGLPPRLAIRKRIEENIEFHADREFVRIIIENLIDNAIKFYNDSQRVDPFVEIDIKNDGESIRIRVTDNGIGISQAQPDKIFQMFSRASERSETGGIGLYITKTAVQKLGGTINLKTTPEGYTEFYVNLPFSTQKVVA
jgi:signal transduction histidine kinase